MSAAALDRQCALGGVLCLALAGPGSSLFAQETPNQGEPEVSAEETQVIAEQQEEAASADMASNEDPDAVRRAERQMAEGEEAEAREQWEFEVYGSVRLHAISTYDIESGESDVELGDGASRAGLSGSWQMGKGWDLFGRVETGFDALDTFAPGAQSKSGGGLPLRLLHVGVESDLLYLKVGKSWSTYYTVAGAADRFSIFGGRGMGVYNAGTDGGETGTGRADEAIQTRLYIEPHENLQIKPFNLNLQYQADQSIPHVSGEDYAYSWSGSAWLENERNLGVGLAYHRSVIDNLHAPGVVAAGIDGDAIARALAVKAYGLRWSASVAFSLLDNIETTNEQRYINSRGAELFTQWRLTDRIWLVGGGNWLFPDDDDPDAGDYVIKYGVLGARYTFQSFDRMVYAEWRDDYGRRADGKNNRNEFTVGVRWDFDY